MSINYEVDKDYEFESVSEKIMAINDRLSAEIITENLVLQFENPNVEYNRGINYISVFKEAYEQISPDDDYYDKELIEEVIHGVYQLTIDKLNEKFRIVFSKDLGEYPLDELINDVEIVHEILFIRQFKNIVDYIDAKLFENREYFVDLYKPEMEEDEEVMRNVFVANASKKFKNFDDVVILHHIDDIIRDILENQDEKSMYMFLEQVIATDPEEYYNFNFYKILEKYGEIISFENDMECFELYLDIKHLDFVKSEIRNQIMLRHLERSELVG